MEKLIEMEQAGVALYIFGPGYHGTYHKTWNILAKKSVDGTNLEINVAHEDLPTVIDDLYERWVKATKGLPRHGLNQIEHQPQIEDVMAIELDNEIPF